MGLGLGSGGVSECLPYYLAVLYILHIIYLYKLEYLDNNSGIVHMPSAM